MRKKPSLTYISPAGIVRSAGSIPHHACFAALFVLACATPNGASTSSSAAQSSSESPSAAASSSGAPSPSSSVAPIESREAGKGRGDGSGGGKRFGEASVYLDGKPLGVIRYLELPEKLRERQHTLLDGRKVPRYSIVDYLEALGVPTKKLKEVHLMGGRSRVSIIRGAELLKHKDDLMFSFTRQTSGKPRLHLPPTPLEATTAIDMISTIAAYIELEPPHVEPSKRRVVMPDGSPITDVPYAKPEESLRGTRVYEDGKLVGVVKRKRLPDSVLSPRYRPDKPRFSLAKYLASVGVDPDRVRELVVSQKDEVVMKLEGDAWKKRGKDAEFSIAPGSAGKVVLHVAKEDGGETSIEATGLFAFERARPSDRISKAALVEPQDGSATDQPDEPERQD